MQQNSLKCRFSLAGVFVFSGVILAALVSFNGQRDSLVTNPGIGLIVSILLLVLSFSSKFNLLLRLTLSYLVGILVNQAMLKSFELPIGDYGMTLFWHLPVLILFFVGFYGTFKTKFDRATEMLSIYLIAGIVLCLHMIILFVLLRLTFGFGYENSPEVFIKLVLFSIFLSGFFSFLTKNAGFRGLSTVMFFYFLAIILVK